jgi:hypothetical protein
MIILQTLFLNHIIIVFLSSILIIFIIISHSSSSSQSIFVNSMELTSILQIGYIETYLLLSKGSFHNL